jgi:hypothetical protein
MECRAPRVLGEARNVGWLAVTPRMVVRRGIEPRRKSLLHEGDIDAACEVFGDATVAAAMIDRLVHHAEVISLKGDSYRLKDRDLGKVPTDDTT